jgi:ABC-type multidrug transport system ATPase subunit
MTCYALTLTAVAVTFRRAVLRDVSLALLPGEIAGIVGAPGAGKTTLLRVAAGLVPPERGQALIGDVSASAPAARCLAGFAPRTPAFPPAVTVRELLQYLARFHASGRTRRRLVHEALELAGLGPVSGTRVAALCRTDVRRLAIAQASMGGRRVLLLDETLSGFDPVARRGLCTVLARLAATGVAVLLAASDIAALERIAARVLVLAGGRIVRAGALAALLRERVLEVILDTPPPEPPPGFRVTATGLEAPLAGRTPEAALALCHAHRLAVRASRVRVKSLEEIVLDAHDAAP